MENFEFDVDASIASAWAQFAERLAEVISVIDDEGSLTLGTQPGVHGDGPMVRFTHVEHHPAMILAEASSNLTLAEPLQLAADEVAAMQALGWNPPDVPSRGAGHGGGSSEGGPASGSAPASGSTPGPESGSGTPAGVESPSGLDAARYERHFWALLPQSDDQELADLAVNTLWHVFGVQHPVFLAPDQLAEVLQPRVDDQDQPGQSSSALVRRGPVTQQVIVPCSRSELDRLVDAELLRMFGHPPLRDQDDDITIRVGSTMVFIRTNERAEEVMLFSTLVHDLEGRSRAVEVLNDLNLETRMGRFALNRDRVFFSLTLLARPFVPDHLQQGLNWISQVADQLDDLLAAKLRGRTTFGPEQ